MAIAKTEITEEMYALATGFAPENDDLERCNCPKAGQMRHAWCGWNYRANLPMFMDSTEE